ncbi:MULTISPECIES: hypothetical protein [unclassified Microcoleus]|nr:MULTISPECIES: hypothetical protein [unclassified Microcoleus]MCC3468940.1 hypothetical protein [Microcoleus sp. PH2017_06_SFM_O_A]MCC3414095.1 hypothetical protein [Microcoleus sp. PH2017_02_FOX_O_A]MCC3492137.1 hypothetical protein [Microcoleus sp. PH2017_16_JOR_D_A]MCC3514094.1 hypothetical protein [Microcoleus sp. PH2017_18_LLB_O_A]MCC3534587.1 hypothetical protein [Microcoleus sp. PH2017_25_DOB_D_A]
MIAILAIEITAIGNPGDWKLGDWKPGDWKSRLHRQNPPTRVEDILNS